MESLYQIHARPEGRFASQLEKNWDTEFSHMGWDARYIGNTCNWADFEIDKIRLEIKPDTEDARFVFVAHQRAIHADVDIVIISGPPKHERWWLGGVSNQLHQILDYPRWEESLDHFLERNHIFFEN